MFLRNYKLRFVAGVGLVLATMSGCARHQRTAYVAPAPAAPLGTVIDQVDQIQEANAENSDFVIYEHEFELGTDRLNVAGKDHVKQIAARLPQFIDPSQPTDPQQDGRFVLVERSKTTIDENSEFEYPVNPNPQLDMQRREVVARSLAAMGISDAEQRVVVSHALTPGQKGTEADRDYQQAISGGGMGGFGGGFGGFGGGMGGFGGGFGGFGGGFF